MGDAPRGPVGGDCMHYITGALAWQVTKMLNQAIEECDQQPTEEGSAPTADG